MFRGIAGEQGSELGFVNFLPRGSTEIEEGREDCITVGPVISSNQREVIRKEQVREFWPTSGNGDRGPIFTGHLTVNVSRQPFQANDEQVG